MMNWLLQLRNRARRERPRPICHADLLDAHVVIDIDSSADAALQGRTISGRVQSCGSNIAGDAADVLILLDEPLAYSGHYVDPSIRWVVASPCVRCEQSEGLFIASSAVRIVDALSIGSVRLDRTIAVGRARCSDGTLV
jgi:hypothetical protein